MEPKRRLRCIICGAQLKNTDDGYHYCPYHKNIAMSYDAAQESSVIFDMRERLENLVGPLVGMANTFEPEVRDIVGKELCIMAENLNLAPHYVDWIFDAFVTKEKE